MRYLALACDYDGTLAHDGRVDQRTLDAVARVRASGRKIILVTGRELPDLRNVCSELERFDCIVAENGALLYQPSTRNEKLLAEPPREEFVQALRDRKIEPLSVGRAIVATRQPNEKAVLEVIRDLGLELQIIFNKGAVMVLPSGVNKGTGLQAALSELQLSPHNVVGIGDAENDHAFLGMCQCAAVVANALPALKEHADIVTAGDHGAGVVELAGMLVDNDLQNYHLDLSRHHVLLGTRDGQPVRFSPFDTNILVAGPSGTGKSTATSGILERVAECGYQFCLIDPEGDYEELSCATTLGDSDHEPVVSEVMHLLEDPGKNIVVNLLGLHLEDRPLFFAGLLSRLEELRGRTGRPHWIVVDEAHHLFPATQEHFSPKFGPALKGIMLITVHPDHVISAALASVNVLLTTDPSPDGTIAEFSRGLGQDPPQVPQVSLRPNEVLAWFRDKDPAPVVLHVAPTQIERRRHRRKYIEGELGEDKSFYFRGPEGKLNLRAQNLQLFMQLAEGVDDATWLHHLRRGHYSQWMREAIKADDLAAEVERIERLPDLSPAESRARIKAAIEQLYTSAA